MVICRLYVLRKHVCTRAPKWSQRDLRDGSNDDAGELIGQTARHAAPDRFGGRRQGCGFMHRPPVCGCLGFANRANLWLKLEMNLGAGDASRTVDRVFELMARGTDNTRSDPEVSSSFEFPRPDSRLTASRVKPRCYSALSALSALRSLVRRP